MEKDAIEVVLGTLLNRATRLIEKEENPRSRQAVHDQANLWARRGDFARAYQLLRKEPYWEGKKRLFGEIIDSYRASFRFSKQWERISNLSKLDLVLETGDLSAARLWTKMVQKQVRCDDYLKIYKKSKDQKDLDQALKWMGQSFSWLDEKKWVVRGFIQAATTTGNLELIDLFRRYVTKWGKKGVIMPHIEAILWIEIYQGSQVKADLSQANRVYRTMIQERYSYGWYYDPETKTWSEDAQEVRYLIAKTSENHKVLKRIDQEKTGKEIEKRQSFEGLIELFREHGEEEFIQAAIDMSFNESDLDKSFQMTNRLIEVLDSKIIP